MEKKEQFEKEISELLGRYNAYIIASGKEVRVLFFNNHGAVIDKIKCFGLTDDGVNGGREKK